MTGGAIDEGDTEIRAQPQNRVASCLNDIPVKRRRDRGARRRGGGLLLQQLSFPALARDEAIELARADIRKGEDDKAPRRRVPGDGNAEAVAGQIGEANRRQGQRRIVGPDEARERLLHAEQYGARAHRLALARHPSGQRAEALHDDTLLIGKPVADLSKRQHMGEVGVVPRLHHWRGFRRQLVNGIFRSVALRSMRVDRIMAERCGEASPLPRKAATPRELMQIDMVAKSTCRHVATQASAAAAKTLQLIATAPFRVKGVQVDGGSEFMSVFEDHCRDKEIELVAPPKRATSTDASSASNRTSMARPP
jgi:hypothetical protein